MSSDYSPNNEEEVDRVMNAEGERQESESFLTQKPLSDEYEDKQYEINLKKFEIIKKKIDEEKNAEKQKVMNDIYRESSQLARKINYVMVLAENEIRDKGKEVRLDKIKEVKERIQSLFQEYGYPMMTPDKINEFVGLIFIDKQFELAILLADNIDEMADKRLNRWGETDFGGSIKRKTSNKKKKTLKSKKAIKSKKIKKKKNRSRKSFKKQH
jgi:hypothetical protein